MTCVPQAIEKEAPERQMSTSTYVESTASSNPSVSDTYVPLLQSTQAYLQLLLQRRAPDAVLTAAWEAFYRIYDELIRRFAVARGLRDADVDDCVQEVWSEVARRLVDFRHPGVRPGLRAWLYAVVRSKATDLIRRKAKSAAKSLCREVELAGEIRQEASDPRELHERQWENAMLQTVMDELRREVSHRSYRVLKMRLLEGRSVADVAAALKLSAAAVRCRQHRMVRRLRARIAVYTGNDFGQHPGT